ncbi:MAG: aminotransferase class I/II-fold pyridoxal phosphate-dependent enzyme, partial [Planctomyces sp.]
MRKVKDSYNCDTLSIAAATAAIEDQSWMIQIRDRIIATRERMAVGLGSAGFNVTPSETNFLWVTHPSLQHQWIYEELKKRKILVRFMRFPHRQLNGRVFDGLRITVGTDPEADALLQAVLTIVPRIPAGSVDSPS